MKKSKFYALCILLAAGAGACESEVTWDGCADNACLGNMITCPDGTVVSKDGICQCQPQNVHCHKGHLYMCGDIIDKTNDDTRIKNAVFSCQNGCNKGNTGCNEYSKDEITDVSNDTQVCSAENKSGCLKDDNGGSISYLCINDKEVIDLKNVNLCQESSESAIKQEYKPCTDSLGSTCENDKLIRCDAISGMRFVVETCPNGCNEDGKSCKQETCSIKAECRGEDKLLVSNTCESESYEIDCPFGCNETENKCHEMPTECENRSCDGKNIVCYLYSGTENKQQLILEECSDECDSEKIVCKEQIEQEEQSDSYLNKLLKECSEDPNTDSLENLKLALNGEVVVDAQYFGKCDLKNSILLGVNENNIETVITVKTSSDQPVAPDALFKSIVGSTIANIKFKYDVEYKGSVETSSDPDDPQNPEPKDETTSPKGMLAHEIKDSTLSNLALKGNLNIIAMQSESQIGSLAGVVSQTKMEDMTFTGSIVLLKGNDAQDHINVSNVGGLIGECQDGCEISKVNITADGENLIQMELTGNNSEDIQNVENIGGLVGNVNASELNDKENEFISNDVNGKIYVEAKSHKITNLGGMFGSITSNFNVNAEKFEKYTVSDSKFKGCIELENSLAENIGGVIGTAVQAGISNISFEAGNCDSGLNIQTSGLDKSQGENGSLDVLEYDVLEYSILKVGGVVGGLTNSMLENINLINTLPSMQLTGAYLNRVGGVVGAAQESRMKNVQPEQSTITLNVKKSSNEDKLGIAFVGGLTGKSANTKYSKVNNKMSLDIKAENTEFPKNIQYIGGLFGSMRDDTFENDEIFKIQLTDKVLSMPDNENHNVVSHFGGLAGHLDNTTIKNISLYTGNIIGNDNIGGFAGAIEGGKFKNITLNSHDIMGQERVGGFAGNIQNSSIHNVILTANEVAGNEYVGGFAGYIKGESDSKNTEITNVSSTVHTVSGHKRVGGFIGTADGKYTISNVNNKVDTVNILGGTCAIGEDSCTYAGGFVSYITKSTNGDITAKFEKILNRVNVMKIEGGDDLDIDAIGGFAGHIQAKGTEKLTLEFKQIQSFAELNLNSNVDGNSYGGFVGYISNDDKLNKIDVSNVFSWGDVKAKADKKHIGGLVGNIGTDNTPRLDLEKIVTVGNVYTDDNVWNHSIVFGNKITEMYGNKECENLNGERCKKSKILIDSNEELGKIYFISDRTYGDLEDYKDECKEEENASSDVVNIDSPFFENDYLCWFTFGNVDFIVENYLDNTIIKQFIPLDITNNMQDVAATLGNGWSVQNICSDTFETSDTIENCKNGGITVPVVKAYEEVSVKSE